MPTQMLKTLCLRWQSGLLPVHVPSIWQIRWERPTRVKPVLQLYVAVEPGVVEEKRTRPLSGADNCLQSTPGGGGGGDGRLNG